MGKDYACDEMFKLNIKKKIFVSSIYMHSSINFWHTHLCHINSKYIGIMSSLGLILMVKKIF